VERKKAADAATTAANEVPVQAATFATPAGVETPATVDLSGGVGGGLSASGDAAAAATADAFGEPIDARVTEGSADLVVTPVAEAVARNSAGTSEGATEGTNGVGAAESEVVNANANGSGSKIAAGTGAETNGETKSPVVNIDVPHDQRPV
jgi:hypothetical protein